MCFKVTFSAPQSKSGLFDNYFLEQFFIIQNKKYKKHIWQLKIIFFFLRT